MEHCILSYIAIRQVPLECSNNRHFSPIEHRNEWTKSKNRQEFAFFTHLHYMFLHFVNFLYFLYYQHIYLFLRYTFQQFDVLSMLFYAFFSKLPLISHRPPFFIRNHPRRPYTRRSVGVGYFRPVNIPPTGTYYYTHTDFTNLTDGCLCNVFFTANGRK